MTPQEAAKALSVYCPDRIVVEASWDNIDNDEPVWSVGWHEIRKPEAEKAPGHMFCHPAGLEESVRMAIEFILDGNKP